MDLLTISEEHRLSTQVSELLRANQDQDYIIKGKMQEKDEQIKKLEKSIAF